MEKCYQRNRHGSDTTRRHKGHRRMSDSQSREPCFESHFLPFRSFGIFVSSTMHQFTQLYEYLAIDSGGNVGE